MPADDFAQFASRPTPDWFSRTKFGIFIHWGAYSVPAWAEPIGALGAVPEDEWFAHNPYAEWYFNTIRIQGSPAAQHHLDTWGGRPYDEFLDGWTVDRFDPAAWSDLFRSAGAGYVVPTTKHHDGIALWDAPGTDGRNTVARGPHRDLIAEITEATRSAGMRVGLYYSGGLDWHVRPFPPHTTSASVHDTARPKDREYGEYASAHCHDLIERFHPDILWNDIEWPDDAKDFEPGGLGELFTDYYRAVPQGLVNDRWGDTHRDYFTSEYESGLGNETLGQWENCRGIGYSFGYNQVEDEAVSLSGAQVARHFVDVVSRGGHLLLNVGPKADGSLADVQVRALTGLAAFMEAGGDVVPSGGRSSLEVSAGDGSWARAVTDAEGRDWLFVDGDGDRGNVSVGGRELTVDLPGDRPGPVRVDLDA